MTKKEFLMTLGKEYLLDISEEDMATKIESDAETSSELSSSRTCSVIQASSKERTRNRRRKAAAMNKHALRKLGICKNSKLSKISSYERKLSLRYERRQNKNFIEEGMRDYYEEQTELENLDAGMMNSTEEMIELDMAELEELFSA